MMLTATKVSALILLVPLEDGKLRWCTSAWARIPEVLCENART